MLNQNPMMENVKGDRMGAVHAQLDLNRSIAQYDTHNNNSWFAFGRYETGGHVINILFHLMAMKVPIIGTKYQSIVTVFDETTSYYFAKDHLYSKHQVEVDTDCFIVKVPNGEMSGNWNNMRACFEEAGIKGDLELHAIHYPLLIGGNSIIEMCGMCIHEYSVPRMTTKGTLVVNGNTYDLTNAGYTWFDRQWQDIDYAHSTMKWTWMAINLDCGDIVSVFDTDLPGYEDNVAAILSPDGSQANYRPIPAFVGGEKEYWTSPESKRTYPVRWEIEIPQTDAKLEIVPVIKEQEIKSVLGELNKYEGNCEVRGTYKGKPASGRALVEMIGPWKGDSSAALIRDQVRKRN